MLFADLIKHFEDRSNSAVLNNTNMIFIGSRVTWTDARGYIHFGVVYDFDDGALTCDILDDNERPHSDVQLSTIKRYGGMTTEKTTGKSKKYSAVQETNLKLKNTKLTAMKFFTSKEAIVWGLPLMRATYLFVNDAFFKGKMVFKGSIIPNLGMSVNLRYYGAFYNRTMKIVLNRNYLQTFQTVTSIMAHEMIHLYDFKFRKNGRTRDTLESPNGVYNPHGEWFMKTAKAMEAALGFPNMITTVEDNLNVEYTEQVKELGEQDEEYDPKRRMGYKMEVDDDEFSETVNQKFYILVHYSGMMVGDEGKPQNFVYAIKTATYEKAAEFAEMIGTDSRIDKIRRNLVDIYECDLKYFEKFLDTPTSRKYDGMMKSRKKIGVKHMRVIMEKCESVMDGQEGGMLQYFFEKIAKLPVKAP